MRKQYCNVIDFFELHKITDLKANNGQANSQVNNKWAIVNNQPTGDDKKFYI